MLSEHGIALREELVLPTPYEVEPARVAARACLTSPHRPTVLICINDFIAVAAIAECRALGRSIPADISVTGFGDWQVAELITPTLTTMRSNPVRIGELTARNIIAQIEGTARREDLQDEFEPELIVRESTAAVKIVAAP